MGKLQYNASNQADFVHTMENIKVSFEALKTELKAMETLVEDNLKGEAARSLKTALGVKAAKIEEETKDWNTVKKNAEEIEKALIEANANAELTVGDIFNILR